MCLEQLLFEQNFTIAQIATEDVQSVDVVKCRNR